MSCRRARSDPARRLTREHRTHTRDAVSRDRGTDSLSFLNVIRLCLCADVRRRGLVRTSSIVHGGRRRRRRGRSRATSASHTTVGVRSVLLSSSCCCCSSAVSSSWMPAGRASVGDARVISLLLLLLLLISSVTVPVSVPVPVRVADAVAVAVARVVSVTRRRVAP